MIIPENIEELATFTFSQRGGLSSFSQQTGVETVVSSSLPPEIEARNQISPSSK